MVDFGYLTLECDGKTLTATFKSADKNGVRVRDTVSVNLAAGTITASTPVPATSSGITSAAKTSATPKQPGSKKSVGAPAKRAKAPAKKAKAPATKEKAKKRAPAKKAEAPAKKKARR
jgi:hypothetical protein